MEKQTCFNHGQAHLHRGTIGERAGERGSEGGREAERERKRDIEQTGPRRKHEQ